MIKLSMLMTLYIVKKEVIINLEIILKVYFMIQGLVYTEILMINSFMKIF